MKTIGILSFLIINFSCSTISTAPFDEEIYQESQKLQKEVNLFLELGTAGKFKKSDKKFYSNFETGINQILDKAKFYKNNEQSVSVINTIKDTFEKMKDLHKKKGLNKANRGVFKEHFSVQFKSLLDIERFKKEKQI
jgi:hypothetical protein